MVPPVTATAEPNTNVCHPDDDSPVKVPLDSGVPVDVHRVPVWVPVFPAPLKNLIPLTKPSAAGTNRTPSSTFEGSVVALTSGTRSPKREQGQETVTPTEV